MTDDQLFGEVDLEERISELEGEVKSLNAFLVHKGFAEEYIRWKGDMMSEVISLDEHRLLCGDATNKEDVDKLLDGV